MENRYGGKGRPPPHAPHTRPHVRGGGGKGSDSMLHKVRLITFTDYHDNSYSFYHFILFLYVLTVLFLYTTYGCSESFPYGRAFVIGSIVVTALPVLLAFQKVFTARRDHGMKAFVACTFLLIATVGAYGIYVYSDHCAADVVRFNVTVADLASPRVKTDPYNLFTLVDGEVAYEHMFTGHVTIRGREVHCAVAPLVSSHSTFNPEQPVPLWVADFAPHLVLANWTQPLRQLIRADDNLRRAAQAVIGAEATNHSLIPVDDPQIFEWISFDTTPKFDRQSFVIAAGIIYGLLAFNTLLPPLYFFFQHTRTATLEITEETYLLANVP